MDDAPPLIKPESTDPAERSLVDDVRQMMSDGRTLLEAELAYQKSRAAVAGQGAKSVAGWAALALAFVFFALMALVMGLVIGLTVWFGPLTGTLTAFGIVLVAAAISGLIAMQRWRRVARQLAEQDDHA